MAWMNTSAAACVLGCDIGDVARIAVKRDLSRRTLFQFDVPVADKVAEKMYRTAPVAAIMEHWRQWAVDVGLVSETDEIERLVIDIDAGEDRAKFYVERKGDMRQLAVKPPMVEFL
jgi:hypothetical protein